RQFYWPDTNVLITRFLSPDGVAEITDFMPIAEEISRDINRCIVRRVTMIRGSMDMQMECFPAFNYARDSHSVEISDDGAAFHSPDLDLGLATSLDLNVQDTGVVSEFTLEEDHEVIIVLREIEPEADCGMAVSPQQSFADFQETVNYWRNWLSQSTYTGRWREMVHRSALALKLMTFEPTGAIVAAPTCSLPEAIGGERNWDYRYTWIRDAAFTLYGLLRIGFTEEAGRFMNYIEARSHELEPDGSLQIMYGIDGRHELIEETLDHLDGYRGSKPVRIGNGAYDQLQLDIYGELMDSVYLYNKYGTPISYDLWTHLRRLVDWIAENWDRKDEGIWEVRGGQKHFVYSKLMAWVALDRAVRLANKRSFPADRSRWLKIRDTIYEDIMDKGWNDELEAFVQSYGSDNLDAANLMMPLVFFLSPNDPRMISTLDAINRSPEDGGLVSNSLVYRYNADEAGDGLKGKEGTFNICTFWLVEAMTRAGRRDPKRLDEARLIFEQMLGYANHVGLYAEETGPCGEALGNFPQAFTHLALISAAFNLDRELGE
ncbi:MAG: glycoside hydrolase family 15 protein, partial [Candidatus Marinimicrobia bacterium]|nr:glycoside hydrolase family 15 protein [Candidatus Neomarinimicrobiota bacterium]